MADKLIRLFELAVEYPTAATVLVLTFGLAFLHSVVPWLRLVALLIRDAAHHVDLSRLALRDVKNAFGELGDAFVRLWHDVKNWRRLDPPADNGALPQTDPPSSQPAPVQ